MSRVPRVDRFVVNDRERVLERHVTPERGVPYVHRVCHSDLIEIGHAMDEMTLGGGFLTESLAVRAFGVNLSGRCVGMTRASVVIAFADEHGHIERSGGPRSPWVVADGRCCLDLLCEFTGFNHRIYLEDVA